MGINAENTLGISDENVPIKKPMKIDPREMFKGKNFQKIFDEHYKGIFPIPNQKLPTEEEKEIILQLIKKLSKNQGGKIDTTADQYSLPQEEQINDTTDDQNSLPQDTASDPETPGEVEKINHYKKMFDEIDQESISDTKKLILYRFYLEPLKDKVSEEILQTITSLNENLKKKFSYLLTLNLNNVGAPDYWNKPPREYIEYFRKTLENAGKGTDFYKRSNGPYQLLDDKGILTMEQLYTIGDLPEKEQPDDISRRNIADVKLNILRQTVIIFCAQYKMDIPQYRKEEIHNIWRKRERQQEEKKKQEEEEKKKQQKEKK